MRFNFQYLVGFILALELACSTQPAPSEVAEPPAPNESTPEQLIPWSCVSTTDGWLDVDVSDAHACGLKRDGAMLCWGSHSKGTLPEDPIDGAVQISVGAGATCVRTASNDLTCFGNPYNDAMSMPPTRLDLVQVGFDFGCGLKDGSVVCWGCSGSTPVCNPPLFDDFVDLCSAAHYSCGLRSGGEVHCWGELKLVPDAIPAGRYTQLACSRNRLCAVDEDGVLHNWGGGYKAHMPDTVSNSTHVSCGELETCVTHDGGHVDCWNPQSNWGPATDSLFRGTSTAAFNSCGVDFDGRVHCWGFDEQHKMCPP